MSTAHPRHDQDEDLPEIIELSEEEGRAILDERARKWFGMSSEEFRRRWLAGEFRDEIERDEVWDTAICLGGDFFRE